jgi:hypothetical protein
MYDYYLGGTANSAADRAAAERFKEGLPEIGEVAWANRGFLQRSVARMAGEWGIRQFLDIGAGLPTQRHVHEIVREVIPAGEASSVVYVDNDPRVVERGRTLLAGEPGVASILGDLREPDKVLADPELRSLIDLSQPVGLLVIAVVHFIANADDPFGAVRKYVDALAPGSALALTSATGARKTDRAKQVGSEVYAKTTTPGLDWDRPKEEVARFFTGLEIVPPYPGGTPEVTFAGLWGAEDPQLADDDSSRWIYAAVARKA